MERAHRLCYLELLTNTLVEYMGALWDLDPFLIHDLPTIIHRKLQQHLDDHNIGSGTCCHSGCWEAVRSNNICDGPLAVSLPFTQYISNEIQIGCLFHSANICVWHYVSGLDATLATRTGS